MGFLNKYFTKNVPFTGLYESCSFILILFTGMIPISIFLFGTNSFKIQNFLFLVISFLVSLSLLIILRLDYNEFVEIRFKKRNSKVKIILDDKIIESDSANYYVGHTKNYIFIYHEKNYQTDVYPMSR